MEIKFKVKRTFQGTIAKVSDQSNTLTSGRWEICLTVVDINSQNQSWSGLRDEICFYEDGTRSNRFAKRDGEYVTML